MSYTPITLKDAIRNGLRASEGVNVEHHVLAHVKDYLAQRFGACMLENQDVSNILKQLYFEIMAEE